jgi:hypothetical protein
MPYKFQVFKDATGEYRFRLIAPNGEIVLASEGYTQKHNCLDTVKSIKENAKDAEIVELD